MTTRPLIYLAGPGVFRADAEQYGAKLKRLVHSFGMEGLWPYDNSDIHNQDAHSRIGKAHLICRWNLEAIREADAILADISPFRGPNMDPGTAMEIGYAHALNKPAWCWSSDLSTLLDRTMRWATGLEHMTFEHGEISGHIIEDFGLPENLMISCPVKGIYRQPAEALIEMANELLTKREAVRA
jgi:nucleoside 2-deoxyribosyltransferase